MYNFPVLTVEFINQHIGREITWHAYGCNGVLPCKGICRILGVEATGEINPVTHQPYIRAITEHIKGNNLRQAWVENDHLICTESNRPVYLGSAFDIYKLISAGKERYFVVRNGENVQTVASSLTAIDKFEIEHII